MGSRTGIQLSDDSLVKLTKRQKHLGLTDGQVAYLLGVSRPMYIYTRTGQRNANVETIQRLCGVMGFRLQHARLVEDTHSRS